jgi:8-oxo-dGTP diphosphatase
MNETEFLKTYDPSAFERPSVTVDLVLLTIVRDRLRVMLVERDQQPALDEWGLPGTFVGIKESLEDAAVRVLGTKAGLPSRRLEQLYTFGAVDRDPRMRIISVAYLGLVPWEVAQAVVTDTRDFADIVADESEVHLSPPGSDEWLELTFDHSEIIATALTRLRGKLDWSDIAYDLLPDAFTLRELQIVHEVILGRRLNKPAFRKRMLDTGRLIPTGQRESGGAAFRPAELYRVARG